MGHDDEYEGHNHDHPRVDEEGEAKGGVHLLTKKINNIIGKLRYKNVLAWRKTHGHQMKNSCHKRLSKK